ncbi:reverse transcriptase [Gossypium australe]|uniref:Reverse transcriptase n=1 Tax=Gossypium australe TaxID=47621 RepID=A0A5B6VMZ0_9ROSI|nr:reverse transcriptase [Gossypium australe]
MVKNGQTTEFSIGDDGNLYFRGRLCILNDLILKQDILSEARNDIYSIHPGSTKIVPIGESRTLGSVRFITTYYDSRMEMRTCHNGFCFEVTPNSEKERCCLGYCGYINEISALYSSQNKLFIGKLHGVLLSIISDWDPSFTSIFWGKLHETLGTKLTASTTFYSQIDGQSE